MAVGSLVIQIIGYRTAERSVTVVAGQTATLDGWRW